jgi:hypothetical protein
VLAVVGNVRAGLDHGFYFGDIAGHRNLSVVLGAGFGSGVARSSSALGACLLLLSGCLLLLAPLALGFSLCSRLAMPWSA